MEKDEKNYGKIGEEILEHSLFIFVEKWGAQP
jgi:hypothetical protein